MQMQEAVKQQEQSHGPGAEGHQGGEPQVPSNSTNPCLTTPLSIHSWKVTSRLQLFQLQAQRSSTISGPATLPDPLAPTTQWRPRGDMGETCSIEIFPRPSDKSSVCGAASSLPHPCSPQGMLFPGVCPFASPFFLSSKLQWPFYYFSHFLNFPLSSLALNSFKPNSRTEVAEPPSVTRG